MKNYPIMAKFDTGFDIAMINNIKNYVSSSTNLAPATTGIDGQLRLSIRNCLSSNIEDTYWIVRLLESYILEVNKKLFRYDLNGWHDSLQYLFYDGKGAGYKWHSDIGAEPTETGIRKLSLVLGLSDINEYEGGELQIILDGRTDMETIKLGLGECVIFPSSTIHRVRPLKSGRRETIVGWYAGPDFR